MVALPTIADYSFCTNKRNTQLMKNQRMWCELARVNKTALSTYARHSERNRDLQS